MSPVTEQLLEIFQGYRMDPTPIDQYEQVGKRILADKLDKFVSAGNTIRFIMLGFPFKSTNERDKVIGKLPDMGEEVTLNNFERFNSDIKQVYEPGVNIGIASDGYIFNDLLEVEDSTVDQYQEISHDLGRVAPMSWYTLRDFFKGSLSEQRVKIVEQLAPTAEKLQADILTNPDVNFLYRGMIHFMEEELAVKQFPSRNQLQKAAKALTRQMMVRNEAWSNLVKTEFKDDIRLSMHPSVNNGQKYSFKLIPGKQANKSAWHSALYLDGDNYVTIHRKEAEEQGLHLQFKDGRPYYYARWIQR